MTGKENILAPYLTFLKQDFGTPAHSSHLQMEKRCAVSAISPVGALLFVKQGLLVAGGQNGNGTYLSTSEMYLGSKWSKIGDLPRHLSLHYLSQCLMMII